MPRSRILLSINERSLIKTIRVNRTTGMQVKQMAADNEAQAGELTRLRYEHQFLQSEYANEKEQGVRIAAEMRIHHDAEVRWRRA